jgi:hypothetical protein
LNDSRDLGEFWASDNPAVQIKRAEIKREAVKIRFMIYKLGLEFFSKIDNSIG